MRKMILVIALLCLSFSFISCTESNISTDINNEQDTENESYVEYEIPEVFVVRCSYYDLDDNGNYQECAYFLFDQNGNEYRYDSPNGGNDEIEDLVSDYLEGQLEDALIFIKTYKDKEGIQNCVSNLQGIANNEDFKIEFRAEISYGTESSYYEKWYGLYYDENHTLRKLCFSAHDEYDWTASNDKRSSEIYNWLRYTED
ncbi:MAG: hypothetical protein MJ126_01615 [Lachnospiraceae bacterium]|nr:hypothetical protein [Lachnospiraceae bacterium]